MKIVAGYTFPYHWQKHCTENLTRKGYLKGLQWKWDRGMVLCDLYMRGWNKEYEQWDKAFLMDLAVTCGHLRVVDFFRDIGMRNRENWRIQVFSPKPTRIN